MLLATPHKQSGKETVYALIHKTYNPLCVDHLNSLYGIVIALNYDQTQDANVKIAKCMRYSKVSRAKQMHDENVSTCKDVKLLGTTMLCK
eukprot:5156278-Pleurochrysis_carterae.AAC.1